LVCASRTAFIAFLAAFQVSNELCSRSSSSTSRLMVSDRPARLLRAADLYWLPLLVDSLSSPLVFRTGLAGIFSARRSEECRVGKEGVSTYRSRWASANYK